MARNLKRLYTARSHGLIKSQMLRRVSLGPWRPGEVGTSAGLGQAEGSGEVGTCAEPGRMEGSGEVGTGAEPGREEGSGEVGTGAEPGWDRRRARVDEGSGRAGEGGRCPELLRASGEGAT